MHVLEVKEEVLPDLDDEFAASLDEEGIETVDQLRERVEENVRARIEAEAEGEYRDEVVDLLLASADIDYPEVLVEREIDRLVDEQSNHASHTREGLDQWLEAIGRTEDEVRDTLREQADLVVRRGLVLSEFASREDIEVPNEEIEDELTALTNQIAGDSTDLEQRTQVRGLFDTPEGRNSIASRILTERALTRLVEIASQPDDDLEPRSARRRSRRRRGARGADEGDDGDENDATLAEGEDLDDGGDEAAAEDAGEDAGDDTERGE